MNSADTEAIITAAALRDLQVQLEIRDLQDDVMFKVNDEDAHAAFDRLAEYAFYDECSVVRVAAMIAIMSLSVDADSSRRIPADLLGSVMEDSLLTQHDRNLVLLGFVRRRPALAARMPALSEAVLDLAQAGVDGLASEASEATAAPSEEQASEASEVPSA